MDYYGQPVIKSYIHMMAMAVDIEHNEAAIPGDGNMPVAFTYTFDVAKFTVALLDVKEWPEQIYIYGDKLTFNELLEKSEKAKGWCLLRFFSFERCENCTYELFLRNKIQGHI